MISETATTWIEVAVDAGEERPVSTRRACDAVIVATLVGLPVRIVKYIPGLGERLMGRTTVTRVTASAIYTADGGVWRSASGIDRGATKERGVGLGLARRIEWVQS